MKIAVSSYDHIYSMDVDKKSIHLAVLDKEKVVKKKTFPNDPHNIWNYLKTTYCLQRGIYVYEAGPTGYGLYDFLKEKGEDCAVAVPSMIPKAPGQRVKTNKLDAYNLGVQLRTGDLRLVQVPEKKYRDLRHLTRLRLKYSRGIVKSKNQLRGLYLFEGIPFPDGHWSRRLISELCEIKYRPVVDFSVGQYLKNLYFFRTQELKTLAEIRRFCRADEEINRCILCMMSIPGFGWIVSTYLLGCLGGYKHLQSATKTAGFFGLGPRENSTGERVRKGTITAVGDPNGRKMIIQASWIAIKKDTELKTVYINTCRVNPPAIGKQKGIVAVARKLIRRCHAVLRDQRPFEKRSLETLNDQKESFAPGSLDSRRVRGNLLSRGTTLEKENPGQLLLPKRGALNSV